MLGRPLLACRSLPAPCCKLCKRSLSVRPPMSSHAAAAVRLHSNLSKLNFPALYAHMEQPLGPAAGSGSGVGGSRGSTPPLCGGSGASTPRGGSGASRLSPFASASAAGSGGVGSHSRQSSPAAATSSGSGGRGRGRGRGGRGGGRGGDSSSGAPGGRVQPVKGSSRYRGVSWNSNCCKWRAQVRLFGHAPAFLLCRPAQGRPTGAYSNSECQPQLCQLSALCC